MEILKASEDYLEAVLMVSEQKEHVRSIDLAKLLGVSKPTVSYTVKRLFEAGYITIDSKNYITLTDAGMAIASQMYERHKLLTDFFISLGVDSAIASVDACKVEHDISRDTFDAICRHAVRITKEK